ncbi:hypothetical protein [Archangium lipolyticum]|uniref:hypothetical protein n=1 Tax=Archangium lipolyticum TaxID=2970465 RepID=UPI002149B021|nr:hypothetical protein [Archangium lipolyticum]
MRKLGCLVGLSTVALLACGTTSELDADFAPTQVEGAVLPVMAPPGSSAWSYSEPRLEYRGNRRGSAVAVDRQGNSYVLAAFDPGEDFKISLLSFDPSGQQRWRRDFPARLDGEFDVTTDLWGNVLIAGSADPSLDLGGGPLGTRAFVAKFSSAGSLLWQKPLCDSATVSAVTTDAYGSVWFGGSVTKGCNIGGGPLWEVNDRAQGFIAKFDALGEYVFSRAIGGKGDLVVVNDLAVTADNGVVVVGGRYVFSESEYIRPFISKFASNGPHRWFREYPEAYGDFWDVDVDQDQIVVVGTYSLDFVFKGVSYPATSIFGTGLVVTYTSAGSETWLRRLGGWVYSVSARAGQVAVLASVGSRDQPLPFPEQVDVSGNSGVLGLYQANGTPIRARGIGRYHQSGWDVALSPIGVATVTGNEDNVPDPTGSTATLNVFGLVP